MTSSMPSSPDGAPAPTLPWSSSQNKLGTMDALVGRISSPDMERDTFGVAPGRLADMIESRNLPALCALGGLGGLAQHLRTDCAAGLSVDGCLPCSDEDGACPPDCRSHRHREDAFGTNRLPDRVAFSFLQLVAQALNDKVLILLSSVAVVSLLLGLYQSFGQPHRPGEPRIEWVDGVTIMVAVTIVVMAGALNDFQKEKQFARLNKKKEDRAVKAVRSGKPIEISVFSILVGDVICLEPGEIAPADGVLIDACGIRCDESSLTGESDQIRKVSGREIPASVSPDLDSDEMDPFIISGSKILEGIGTFLVTGVGENSQYGRLRMGSTERTEATPLQQRLSVVADRIAIAGLGAAILLFLVLTAKFLARVPWDGDSLLDNAQTFLRIFTTSIAVVVIAVPEGLPLAVTLALAIAVTRMLKDNNLVRVMTACETMGNATTICCDKTGTLTTNRMAVVAGSIGVANRFSDAHTRQGNSYRFPWPQSMVRGDKVAPTSLLVSILSPAVRELLMRSIALNTTAFLGEGDGISAYVGSKTEAALLTFAEERLGMSNLYEERANAEITAMFPFGSHRKCMATVVRLPNGVHRMYMKGAPEIVLEHCTKVLTGIFQSSAEDHLTEARRMTIMNIVADYNERSMRTICVAYRDFLLWPPSGVDGNVNDSLDEQSDQIFGDLTLLSVFALQDPLRAGVKDAVKACQRAGVDVKMVTGDHVKTATAIATECGILDESGLVMEGREFRALPPDVLNVILPRLQVLARSTPDDKKMLVTLLKAQGETVAVTGDGANDGPALRAADVGFAMGLSGTEVTKDASAIVLMDDNFASIVKAIEWGRAVNDAIKKFLQFQLTVNVTAVTLTFVSAIAGDTEEAVLTPVQLLWVNLIMDTFAALALATDPPGRGILDRQPERRLAPLVSPTSWKMIVGQSVFQLVVILALHFAGNRVLGYATPAEKASLRTLIFNTYVWMQVFNLYNNRRLDDKLNVFEGIHKNLYFIGINLVMIIGQVLIMLFGGQALSVVPLSLQQWGISLGLGAVSLPMGVIIKLIPGYHAGRLRLWKNSKGARDESPPAVDDDSLWSEALESLRTELACYGRARSSRAWRLVGEKWTALRTKLGVGTRRNTTSEEARRLLERTRQLFNPQPHSAFAPAAVMAGIVAGSVAGWPLPSRSSGLSSLPMSREASGRPTQEETGTGE